MNGLGRIKSEFQKNNFLDETHALEDGADYCDENFNEREDGNLSSHEDQYELTRKRSSNNIISGAFSPLDDFESSLNNRLDSQ